MIERHHLHIETNTKRVIVISDIHGHLSLFKKLLEKVNYQPVTDTFILLGDYIEKGEEILSTFDFVEQLAKIENVYILNGNCEWAIYNLAKKLEFAPYFKGYLRKQPNSIFHEILKKKGVSYEDVEDVALQQFFQKELKHQFDFINQGITTLETQDYLFVHAGIEPRMDYENSSLSSLLEQQRFYEKSHPLDKYIVVGHLPTSNYHRTHIDNSILISDERRIISIDGGVGVKKVCQLNALIIEDHKLEEVYVRDYPIAIVNDDCIVAPAHHHKIAWPSYEVRRLVSGDEFTLCQKTDTLEKLMIKNEYLYSRDNQWYCLDDYEDFRQSVKKGSTVEVIERLDQYSYVIQNNEVFWMKTKYLDLH